ncbi:MAG TPA: glycosyltransferase family 39 protein [Kiritimatiellia bacterium]|nr:glycosyltransferase family 39 protein [Kiritimatiellia bacterium]
MKTFEFNRVIPFRVLVLLALFLWGGEYVLRDPWEPDEARFTLVAREMREGNHWLVPHRQGEFYTHKPPLMFWLINAGVAAGLPENAATRLPSFLGALMALWSITRLAARWHSPRTSWWVALLLPSSFLFWNKGGFGQIDMLLCGLEMMGLWFLFTTPSPQPSPAMRERGPDRLPLPLGEGRGEGLCRLVAAYLFLGLAVLAKGPVGLVIPLAVFAAASWAAGEGGRLRGWHWVWGPLLALSLPGLWLLAAWWSGAPDGFFHELLFSQNVGRVTGEFGGHEKPWYYFLLYFPVDFMPWTLALPLAVAGLMRRDEDLRALRRLVAWIVVVILLFSLSASKRNLYILLVYPAAALLVAASVERWADVGLVWIRNTRRALLALAGLVVAGLVAAAFVPRADLPWWSVAPSVLALLVGVALAMRWPAGKPAWLAALAASVLVCFSGIGSLVYHQFNDEKTPVEFVAVAQRVLPPGHYIVLFKQQGEIISLFTRRPGRMADDEDELRALLAAQPSNLIVAQASRLGEIRGLIGDHHPHGAFSSGSKKQIWVEASGSQPLLLEPAEQRAGAGDESGEHDPRG